MSNQVLADLEKIGSALEAGYKYLDGLVASTPSGANAIATAKQNLSTTASAIQAAAPEVETAVITAGVDAAIKSLPAPFAALGTAVEGDIDSLLIGIANGLLAKLTTAKASVVVAASASPQ